MSQKLNPRFTFETFVVGPANRLAAAAAQKAAEAPGKVYNPLFIYSASGLGKTHLLGAIRNAVEQHHALSATYESTPQLLEALSRADDGAPPSSGSAGPSIVEESHRLLQEQLGYSRAEFEPLELVPDEADSLDFEPPETDIFELGPIDPPPPAPPPAQPSPAQPSNPPPGAGADRPMASLRGRFRDVAVLLLDDVQFLAGEAAVQQELLRTLDLLTDRGAQVVLTSDRPPQEIDGLDDRLLTRLSGGLIVDMGAPDFDTRVAIARRNARDRGAALTPDTFRALARVEFSNVRELQGALNRLIAVQELEEREVKSEEVPRLLGRAVTGGSDEFRGLLGDMSGALTAGTDRGNRRVANALLQWESRGFQTRRLDKALRTSVTAAQADKIVGRYERDAKRLLQVAAVIRKLDPEAPELADEVLSDPDRVEEAQARLVAVRERAARPPAPPAGPGLEHFDEGGSLAVRAVRAVLQDPGRAYNPLYVQGPTEAGRALLVALAQALAEKGLTVAFNDSVAFAQEYIQAVKEDRVDEWRARYRQAHALLLTGLDQLGGLARGHDELFHLFEGLHSRSRQLVFSSVLPPKDLILPPRLQSRLEAGLVVELEPAADARTAPDRVGVERRAPTAPETPEARPSPALEAQPSPTPEAPTPQTQPSPTPEAPTREDRELAEDGEPAAADGEGRASSSDRRNASEWILSPEKVLLEWPEPMDWIQQSPG